MAWRLSKPIKPTFWSTRTYPLIVFIVMLLVVSNIVLVHLVFDRKNWKSDSSSYSTYFQMLRKNFIRKEKHWQLAIKNITTLLEHNVPEPTLNCRSLEDVKNFNYIATGWTKVSYSAVINNQEVAVKMVNVYGHDVTQCLKWNSSRRLPDCYRMAASKILREIYLLKVLVHPNVIEMLGYCIPVDDYNGAQSSSVSVITELGQPLDVIGLLQMSWEDRLRVSLGMAHLLYHLAHSPLGSLLMSDFRRQQFVLVKGKLKLSDVDDIVLGDPTCFSDKNCTIYFPQQNLNFSVTCKNGVCLNFNEKLNILRAGRHFMSFILPHGVPGKLQSYVDAIVDAYSKASWDTKKLMQKTEEVVRLFVQGFYRNKTSKRNTLQNYKVINNSDLPGQFDYHCQLTLSGHGCTLSMFDSEEAAQICSGDPECKAFVLTNDTTWTGRKIVHFKNGYSTPVQSLTTLFIKIN